MLAVASVIFMQTSYAGEFVLLDPMQCVTHFVLED